MSNESELVGKTLGGCTLIKLLGQGGMGAVFLAEQIRPARNVAVKVLRPNVPPSSRAYNDFLVRFRREADVIAKLEHVNIMPIYEYGEQDGLAYLVMPYFSGGTLRDLLSRRGALSMQETATYLDQAAYALSYAHSHNVIHRDIKPSNFLIANDGRLVLADFGIARMMQEQSTSQASTLTGTGMMLGTPDYMAPEMAHGEQIDQRADIYELGILVFQMLTGRVPFTGSTPLMVAVKHLQEPLPALSSINPAIPPAVDNVLLTATAKKREDRYMSALDLAQAFRVAINTPHAANYMPGNDAYATHGLGSSPSNPGIAQEISAPSATLRQDTPLPPLTPQPLPVVPFSQMQEVPAAGFSGAQRPAPPYNAPAAPYVPYAQPPTEQKSRSNIPLLIIGALLIVALVAGATFFALRFIGGQSSSTGNTSTSTGGTQITPTPVATTNPTATTPPTPTATPLPTPTPMQKAEATVKSYFDDINVQDYHGAYNFFGSYLQHKQSYDSFASGYATTVQDVVSIGSITSNSDGTFNVPVTITATEDNASGGGTHMSTYQGYYVVGTENGQWKLLNASINKVS